MAFKKWLVGSPDRALAKELAEECDIDPFVAMIAAERGYSDPAELEQLISPELQLCDPRELADIEKAAARIEQAIENGERIAVFGDYDCDGVTATALLYDYLRSRGCDTEFYIPDRQLEGYGMNKNAVKLLGDRGVKLIVTVDNGISCAGEITYAAELGIDTVVTDHHIPPETLPDAVAVVDPHRADCPSSFKEICGAAVAFKLVCVLDDKAPEQLLSRYADLLCIATVGDVMPLIGENRSIVRAGLVLLKNSPRTGVSALLQAAGTDRSNLTASSVAFGISPRINAAGRMGSAVRALNLLLCENMLEALQLAAQLDDENTLRQQTERKITAEACEKIEKNGYQYSRVIVVSGEGWHSGVVGIAAARICEKYGKPTVVLTIDGDTAHGSGRSIPGFSLYNAISSCSDTLERFGGHEAAAGVSLKSENINKFRKEINDYAANLPGIPPEIHIDLKLNPAAMTVDMADSLSVLEPFGFGNPEPVFGLFGVSLNKITPIGSGKHLKLIFSREGAVFQALLFGVTPQQFCFQPGDLLDLAVRLESSEYQGTRSLSVIIRAMRLSGTDDEALFESFFAYNDYISGRKFQPELLAPTREQVGEVYRVISRMPVSAERIKYLGIISPGFGKTQVALTVLSELSLIRLENGVYTKSAAQKTNLEQSATFRRITERGN